MVEGVTIGGGAAGPAGVIEGRAVIGGVSAAVEVVTEGSVTCRLPVLQ